MSDNLHFYIQNKKVLSCYLETYFQIKVINILPNFYKLVNNGYIQPKFDNDYLHNSEENFILRYMNKITHPSWDKILQAEFEKDYFQSLENLIDDEYTRGTVYPPQDAIFQAFRLCHYDKISVIILGQDPYHGHGEAIGLGFAVNSTTRKPPSLRNIYREIQNDLVITEEEIGGPNTWSEQGILLLNSTLTVRANSAASHRDYGWKIFTNNIINTLAQKKDNLVFILWGHNAQRKSNFIDDKRHLIIKSAHPSPLSAYRGFFNSRPFSTANNYLKKYNKKIINW